MNEPKIVLFLMGEIGHKVLLKIVQSKRSSIVKAVYCCQDQGVKEDYFEETRELCAKYQITFLNQHSNIEVYQGYKFAIKWRWLINDTNKLIVFHDSILPKYRGFIPLVNSLINKEEKIGVTALLASDNYDCGPIIDQKSVSISYPIKIDSAIKMMADLYVGLFEEVYKKISLDSNLISHPQNEELATYSLWRDEKDYFINWQEKADKIKRMVDALGYPYKGAKSYIDGKTIMIKEVEEIKDLKIENRDCGKIIFLIDSKFPVIVCGQGLIKITDAIYEDNQQSIFPLGKFRIRIG